MVHWFATCLREIALGLGRELPALETDWLGDLMLLAEREAQERDGADGDGVGEQVVRLEGFGVQDAG